MIPDDYQHQTIDAYDEYASVYQKKFDGHFNRARPFADQFIREVRPGSRVIDLGAGTGIYAKYFEENGLDPLCIDLSEEMVRACRKKGLEAVPGDILSLGNFGFSTDYGGVWAYASLLHIPKKELSGVLRNIEFILADDGVFCASFKHKKKKDGFEGMVDQKEGGRQFFAYYTHEELVPVLSEYFEIVKNDMTRINDQTQFLNYVMRKKIS